MKNLPQYVMYLLFIVAAAVFFISLFGDSHDPMLYVMYLFTGICLVVALASAVLNMINKPSTIKSSAMGLGAFLLIFVVAYFLASDEVMEQHGELSATTSKLSGTGLYMFYILIVAAAGAIVFSAVSKLFK